MSEFREIFLHFCVECGTVQATAINVRHLDATHPTHQAYCNVCEDNKPFSPVVIDFKQQKFLTRVL